MVEDAIHVVSCSISDPRTNPSVLLWIADLSTANEGSPVRIQYKWLVPIYASPEMKLLFPKQNYNVLSSSSYSVLSHRYISVGPTYICERFIYFQDHSAYFAAGKYVNRPLEYINRSRTHECGNWD